MYPSSHVVDPVQDWPPHWPQREIAEPDEEEDEEEEEEATGALDSTAAGVDSTAAALEVAAGETAAADEEEASSAVTLEDEDEEEEESEIFPIPAPALTVEATWSAAIASQIESAPPMALTTVVSVKEPKSPELVSWLTWQSRPRALEHWAAALLSGTVKRPLVTARAASVMGALQSSKTLPSIRICAPCSMSKLWPSLVWK